MKIERSAINIVGSRVKTLRTKLTITFKMATYFAMEIFILMVHYRSKITCKYFEVSTENTQYIDYKACI